MRLGATRPNLRETCHTRRTQLPHTACARVAVWIDVRIGAGPNPYGFPYGTLMADVVTTGEARDALHQIARRFDNGDGEPVYFGSHRRAQGVIVPVDVWERLLDQAEDELDLASARQRLAHDDGRRLTGGDLGEAFRGAAEAASREPA